MLKTGSWPVAILAALLIAVQGIHAQGTGGKIIDPGLELADNGRSLGVLISGVNLTGSSANTLGGWGHFSVGVTGALSHPSFLKGNVSSGSVVAVLRAGLTEGMILGPGLHGVGSIDIYLRLGTLRANGRQSADTDIWGLGTRIGILRNSILTPAVSISAGYTRTGSFGLSEVIHGPYPGPRDADISTLSIRCDVSKNLFFLTPMAGIGFNRTRIEGAASANVPSGKYPYATYFSLAGYEVTRTDAVYYAGVEWNFFLFRLGLEVGRTGGETIGSTSLRLSL
ncbi:MAG: hypothetical protein U9P14_09555 [Gemmatimonadota bacterium]|nr:hypothetical protein [Gemmatimonadota bacterium]